MPVMSQNPIASLQLRFHELSPLRSTLWIAQSGVWMGRMTLKTWSPAAHAIGMMLAGWIHREEEAAVTYQKEEIRALREMLGGKRLGGVLNHHYREAA